MNIHELNWLWTLLGIALLCAIFAFLIAKFMKNVATRSLNLT